MVLAGPASALPDAVDLTTSHRLLDIGGGPGSWSMAIARRYPNLTATIRELATVADLARDRIAAAGLTERIDVVFGDATAGELPAGHDVFLLANLAHYWSPEQNCDVLVRATAVPDARLLLADFWTDSTHTQPVHDALMAGEFAVHLRNGDIYGTDKATAWLETTGCGFSTTAPSPDHRA